MRAIGWALAGAAGVVGAAGLAVLIKKTRESSDPVPASEQEPIYGEQTRVALAVPAGWRRVSGSEIAALPELRAQASAALPGVASLSYGTLAPFVASNGATYATWVEQHYHAPGGSAQPWGLHHGVTLLAKTA